MLVRIISGTFLLIAAIFFLLFGGLPLLLILLFCSEVGLFEFYRATKVLPEGKIFSPLSVTGYLLTGVFYVFLFWKNDTEHMLFIAVSLIVITMMIYVFTFPKYHADQIAYCIFGFLYVPLMLSFVYRVRALEHGIFTVWLIFLASWVCDTCAYLTGMAIGKHKLAPVLSPKKSIEGAIGGILGSVLAGFLYSYFVLEKQMPGTLIGILIVCAVGAVVSQTGDLAASAIKRNHEIKDYGHLIPGHGGILDRFDSVIFTAPMIYFLIVFVVNLFM
ncbi:MAG: phosphatidate cytidylyltransferase [Lachnospiraceae bacterium]|nr:phosphatidate cytidylyltransferase [Lachnospiraceae bacterium]